MEKTMKMIKKYWAVIVGVVAAVLGLIWITKASSAKKQSDLNKKIKSNEKQVALLQDNISLYIEREKQFKPKWYNAKSIWYGLGIATSILIFEIVK